MSDKVRESVQAKARKKKYVEKQKQEKKKVEVVFVVKRKKKNENTSRKIVKLGVIERHIHFIRQKDYRYVTHGLETIRWRTDRTFEVMKDNGKPYKKPDDWDGETYFKHATESVEHGVVEAIAVCLKKRMLSDTNITMLCLNLFAELLKGYSWIDDGVVSQEDETSYFGLVRKKGIGCDMVSTLLLLVEKMDKKSGSVHRDIVTESMVILSKLVSHKHELEEVVLNLDAAKEFVIVEAIDQQLSIQPRGPMAFPIVTKGLKILIAFIRMYPELRRNSTCKLIHRLLVDVYDIFYPLPFYFSSAIAVLDVLLQNDMNAVHFQNRALLIYNFLLKYHSSYEKQRIYKDLEKLLFAMVPT